MATVTTKECDYCGEDILERAKKCKHCGETLDPVLRRVEEASRGGGNGGGGGGGAAACTTVVMHAGMMHDNRPHFPHAVHLIMSVLTAGFWIPVWILHYLGRGKTYRGS